MKHITLLIITFFVFTNVKSSAKTRFTDNQLSDSSTISLITCGAGDELYALFGHTAIRIQDPINNVDLVFNYGTFDMDTPNFLWKFIMGDLDYFLSVYPFKYFPSTYIKEGRWIKEEGLNLPLNDIKSIYTNLIETSQDDRRFYRYDFYFENCATKIRDVIYSDTSLLKLPIKSHFTNVTFRDEMNKHLINSPWVNFGLNLLLGSNCDKRVDNWSAMYMPDNLSLIASNSFIKHNVTSSNSIPLTRPQRELVSPKGDGFKGSFITPIVLIILYITLYLFFRYLFINIRVIYLFEFVLFLLVGVVGLLVFFFSFISHQSICLNNYMILFTSPIYLFLLTRYSNFLKVSKLQKYLIFFLIFVLLLFLISGIISLQVYSFEVYLLALFTLYILVNKVWYINKEGSI